METNADLFTLKNERTLIKKKRLNLWANLLIAILGVTSLYIKFFLVDGVLAFRAFTVDGNIFTTIVAIIYVFTEWRDLRNRKETHSNFLYFLKACSAVTEAVIFIVVMIGYLPIFKDNPKITPYHMFCLHVAMPVLTVAAFVFFNSPIGVLKPLKLVLGSIPIFIYGTGVCIAIKVKLLPMKFVPYSFLNFDDNFIWYLFFALVTILSFGYFWTWLFYRLNLKMAMHWYNEEDLRTAQKKRIEQLSAFDSVNSFVLLLFLGIAIALLTVTLAMSSRASSQMANAFIDYTNYDDYYFYEQTALTEEPWVIKDGSLCKGDWVFGDGTEEHANRDAVDFGLDYYRVSIYKNADTSVDLYDPANASKAQFILVTETLPENGVTSEKIGSALPVGVAELLFADDAEEDYMTLYTEEKIDGEEYRSFYTAIFNTDGDVLGVARTSVKKNEITNMVKGYLHFSDIIMMISVLLAFTIVYLITYRTAYAFARMVNYMEKVCNGEVPDEPLYLGKSKRMMSLAAKVNKLAEGRAEKKEQSEEAAPKE